MTILQSIFLGLIQGLTEFLPVSSSGHLSIARNIFHIDTGNSVLFDILLHVATLAVVIIYFRREIGKMIVAFFGMLGDLFHNIRTAFSNRGQEIKVPYRPVIANNYRRFVILILVSTIPTGIIGYLGRKLVSGAAGTLIIPGICLLVTGALLMISDRLEDGTKIPRDVTMADGLLIGAAQGLATLPGLSRSGTTITACLLCGLNRTFAIKYSFILSIPAILGAAVLEIGDAFSEAVSAPQLGIFAAGMAVAALTGFFSIRVIMSVFQKRKFRYFALYCFIIGIVAIAGQFIFL